MTTLTTSDHTDAALARLATTMPDWAPALRLDEAARTNPKPANYVELVTVRRYMEDPRVTPVSTMRLWRVTAYWVAITVGNADTLEAAILEALEGYSLTVGTGVTTPLQHETSEPTAQDRDTSWVGYVDLTYAI